MKNIVEVQFTEDSAWVVPSKEERSMSELDNRDIINLIEVKSKFVCKLLLGTCGAKGCLASLS